MVVSFLELLVRVRGAQRIEDEKWGARVVENGMRLVVRGAEKHALRVDSGVVPQWFNLGKGVD